LATALTPQARICSRPEGLGYFCAGLCQIPSQYLDIAVGIFRVIHQKFLQLFLKIFTMTVSK
jgi:hypothetical protein